MDPSLPPREVPPLQPNIEVKAKHVKKKLWLFLAAVILLITLGLTWFLGFSKQTNLPNFLAPSQKTSSGNTYSVLRFNPKTTQSLRQGDILTGKGLASTPVVILITPGNHKAKINTDIKGGWSYQIPGDLKDGDYYLAVELSDQNKVISVNSYPVNIKSSNIFSGSLFIPMVHAQSTGIAQGPNYASFVTEMQKQGYYPHQENGQIVLYNHDQFEANFCQGQGGCIENSPSNTEILSGVNNDVSFIEDLENLLLQNKYAPFESLLPYFPQIADTNAYKLFVQRGSVYAVPPSLQPNKTQIDATTLSNFIKEEATRQGLSEKDPVQILIGLSDPIFGTKALIAWATLPPSQVTDDQRLSALLSLGVIYGMSEKVVVGGIKLTGNMSVDLLKAGKTLEPFAQSIKNGEHVPLQVLEDTVPQWSEIVGVIPPGDIFEHINLPTDFPAEAAYYWQKMTALTGDYIFPARTNAAGWMDNVYSAYTELVHDGYIDAARVTQTQAVEPINRNWVIGIRDDKWQEVTGLTDAGGVAEGRAILVRSTNLNSEDVMTHEFVHVVGYIHQQSPEVQFTSGAVFDRASADRYSKIISILYEMGTDDLSANLSQSTSVYRQKYPELAQSIDQMVEYLKVYSNGNFSWRDLHALAYTGDDARLLKKLVGSVNQQKFVDLFDKNINLDVSSNVSAARTTINFDKLNQVYSASVRQSLRSLITPGVGDIAGNIRGFIPIGAHNNAAILLPDPNYPLNLNILDSSTPTCDVAINGVDGQLIPGGTLTVSSITACSGSYPRVWTVLPDENPPQTFHLIPTVYARIPTNSELLNLGGIIPVPGGAGCGQSCQITLPPNLQAGRYKLEVLLTNSGSTNGLTVQAPTTSKVLAASTQFGVGNILALDSLSINVVAQAAPPGAGGGGAPAGGAAAAPAPNPGGGGGILGPDPAGVPQLQAMIQRIINLTAPLVFIVLTIMLVYAGIRFITSNGEPKNIQLAQQTATWAILGIVLLVGAWLILRLIEAFTGVPVTQFCIGFRPYCLI